jgi:hypothetical protein
MLTWDEITTNYEILKNSREDSHILSKVTGSMLKILPSLRHAVEERAMDIQLSRVMFALELSIPSTYQRVVVQSVDEGKFVLRTKNSRYKVLRETEADFSNVVEQTIQHLELTRRQD